MTLKELQNLIKIAKKAGISKIKFGDTELEFSKDMPIRRRTRKLDVKDISEEQAKEYSDMDVLMWSVPGGDAN